MDRDLVVFGSDIISNPNVSTSSTGGNADAGVATVRGGRRVFEDDDVVVVRFTRLDANGEVQNSTRVADVTVYETAADFAAGTVKFDYAPQNPGQTANVQNNVSGNGDAYVRVVGTNIFKAQDGGPGFNQLFIAPGSNVAAVVGDEGQRLVLDRNTDFDFNGDGDADDPPVEPGNGAFFVGDYVTPVICFAAGTLIRTPEGERLVETLVPEDRVATLDHGTQTIRWVGRRRVPARGDLAPVRIDAGALSNDRALVVSPNHRVVVESAAAELHFAERGVLVAAKHLVGRPGITQVGGGTVDYVHILFDDHELIWANGCLAESLCPVDGVEGDGGLAAAQAELALIFPEAEDMARARRRPTARRSLRRYEVDLV